MSQRGGSPKLDLRLNLSPPRPNPQVDESHNETASSWETSPEGSCVSSEAEEMVNYSNSGSPAIITTTMVLAGCPRCLMYVMLSEADHKCPKCKSTVLLDFLTEENNKKTAN